MASAEDELRRALALYEALAGQQAVAVLFVDGDLRVRDALVAPEAFGGLIAPDGTRLTALLAEDDRQDATTCLRAVLATGSPEVSTRDQIWTLAGTREPLRVAATVLRANEALVVTLINITEQVQQSRRLRLLQDSADVIGTSLDVTVTAQQLADVLVPDLADIGVISLAREVRRGEEPPLRTGGGDLNLDRTAVAPAGRRWPDGYRTPGMPVPTFRDPDVIQIYQAGQAFSLVVRRPLECGRRGSCCECESMLCPRCWRSNSTGER